MSAAFTEYTENAMVAGMKLIPNLICSGTAVGGNCNSPYDNKQLPNEVTLQKYVDGRMIYNRIKKGIRLNVQISNKG